MSTQHSEDRELEELLKETPIGAQAPDELKRRLRTMAAGAGRRKEWTWTPRIAVVAAAGIVLAALTMLLWPTPASARTFQKVLDATNQTKTFSITVDETGRREQNDVKIVGAGGRLEIQTGKGVRVQIDGGKLSMYDPKENCLTVIKLGELVDPQILGQVVQQGIGEALKQADVKKLLEGFKTQYGEANGRISDTFLENDRKVYTIEFKDSTGPSGAKITVDADSSLPTRIQVHDERGSNVDLRMQLGGAVQIEPLDASVPKDATRKELDLGNLMRQGPALAGAMGQLGLGLGKDGKAPSLEEIQKLKELGESFKRQAIEKR
jgi:outer membrane lipoprotein-sorting protein